MNIKKILLALMCLSSNLIFSAAASITDDSNAGYIDEDDLVIPAYELPNLELKKNLGNVAGYAKKAVSNLWPSIFFQQWKEKKAQGQAADGAGAAPVPQKDERTYVRKQGDEFVNGVFDGTQKRVPELFRDFQVAALGAGAANQPVSVEEYIVPRAEQVQARLLGRAANGQPNSVPDATNMMVDNFLQRLENRGEATYNRIVGQNAAGQPRNLREAGIAGLQAGIEITRDQFGIDQNGQPLPGTVVVNAVQERLLGTNIAGQPKTLNEAYNDAAEIVEDRIAQRGEQAILALPAVAERAMNSPAYARIKEKAQNDLGEVLTPSIDTIYNKAVKLALITAGLAVGTIAAWYGMKAIWNYMNKPELILESSQLSMWEKFKGIILTRNKEKTEDMIFSPELEKRLSYLTLAIKNIHGKIKAGAKDIKYRNLLFWGPPGTGKTMFAKKLAKESGMDYVILSGQSFEQFKEKGEGIQAMNKLFEWAKKSKNGVLIFIDEAETILSDRKKMDINSDAYKLLSNFISHTGELSDKFMLVYATNYPNVLDEAVGSRISDEIEFALPEFNERVKLLKMYINKVLLNSKINEPFKNSVTTVLTDSKVDQVANMIDGLSCREISNIMNAIKTDAEVTPTGFVVDSVVDETVVQAIAKNKKFATNFENVLPLKKNGK